MSTPTAEMLAHLALNVTHLCDVWRITARDGLVIAYANLGKNVVYDGVTFKATPNEPTRGTRKLNLEPDGVEFQCVYDAIATEEDVYAQRWRDARIQKDIICYLDPDGVGSALTQRGFVGKVTPGNGIFTVEFLSLSSRLDQTIGDYTSPVDRRRRASETGVDMGPYTYATTVDTVTSRRKFKVLHVQALPNYFQYGIAEFTGGANAGREFEVKYSNTTDGGTRTEIELQKNTPGIIAPSDAVTLYIGYDGTRAAAKALGEEAMINFDGEPDMPLPDDVLRYQP